MAKFIEVTSTQTGTSMYIRSDLIAQILPTKDAKQTLIHLDIKGDRPVVSVSDSVEEVLTKYNNAVGGNNHGISGN